jgi:hypothetical protein
MRKVVAVIIALAFTSPALAGYGPKPAKWCGWFMRQEVPRDPGEAFNVAIKWATYGMRAPGPATGVIVVWPHHVGKIVGHDGSGWIVRSGNDNHAVRERVRPLKGVIAYRWPTMFSASVSPSP